MGRLFLINLRAEAAPAGGGLGGVGMMYRCKRCATHLVYATEIISKTFRCKYGKAYLFSNVVNVVCGEKDDRMMTTGLHTVCDIFCVSCSSILGWKYLSAFEKSQRYKEGKFILERCKVSSVPIDGTVGAGQSSPAQQVQRDVPTPAAAIISDTDEEDDDDVMQDATL